MMKRVAVLALLACTLQSQAQTTSTSPAKKELVQKLLAVQRPAFEGLARSLVERPAARMMQDAGRLLQTEVPADKREEVGKAIQADVKKYLDETVPPVVERSVKLAPSTLGTALEEKFTEDELKQLLAWFESPVNKKYQQIVPEVQDGFIQKLVADSRDVVEPKVKALEASVGKRLGVLGNAPAAAPAKGASAPAKKR
jgi:uncharacterized protein